MPKLPQAGPRLQEELALLRDFAGGRRSASLKMLIARLARAAGAATLEGIPPTGPLPSRSVPVAPATEGSRPRRRR